MDLHYDDQTCAFRDEVRAFLAANAASFPTESYDTAEGFEQHRHWDRVLFDAGLSVIAWPRKYGGRDATLLQWVVFEEEYFRAGAPGRASANGTSMLAPTPTVCLVVAEALEQLGQAADSQRLVEQAVLRLLRRGRADEGPSQPSGTSPKLP
jgi:alkylation response protein AidB-like acyl-CoA dehydrogenase